jgi:hypothetical protein
MPVPVLHRVGQQKKNRNPIAPLRPKRPRRRLKVRLGLRWLMQ